MVVWPGWRRSLDVRRHLTGTIEPAGAGSLLRARLSLSRGFAVLLVAGLVLEVVAVARLWAGGDPGGTRWLGATLFGAGLVLAIPALVLTGSWFARHDDEFIQGWVPAQGGHEGVTGTDTTAPARVRVGAGGQSRAVSPGGLAGQGEHLVQRHLGPVGHLGVDRDDVGNPAVDERLQRPDQVGQVDPVHRGAVADVLLEEDDRCRGTGRRAGGPG